MTAAGICQGSRKQSRRPKTGAGVGFTAALLRIEQRRREKMLLHLFPLERRAGCPDAVIFDLSISHYLTAVVHHARDGWGFHADGRKIRSVLWCLISVYRQRRSRNDCISTSRNSAFASTSFSLVTKCNRVHLFNVQNVLNCLFHPKHQIIHFTMTESDKKTFAIEELEPLNIPRYSFKIMIKNDSLLK